MGIGIIRTTDERAAIEVLCQQNREAFLRMEFMLGDVRPLSSLSTEDIMCLIGIQIEEMDRKLDELNEMLTSDGRTGSSS